MRLDGLVVLRVDVALHDHAGQLVAELAQADPHVLHLQDHDLLQQGDEVAQLCVFSVALPRLNEDARVFLQQEVLGDVVHDDGLREGAPDLRQVLDDDRERVGLGAVDCVLTIQTI